MRWLILLPLWSMPAAAQPADCIAVPIGPGMAVVARPDLPGGRHGTARIDLGEQPIVGTRCRDMTPPPEDILRGAPVSGGLLPGGGKQDLLRNRPVP